MNIDSPLPPSVNRRREIFLAALEQAHPQARSQYLDSACGTDSTLRKAVEALLSEQKHLGGFLEAPAMRDARRINDSSDALSPDGLGRGSQLEGVGSRIDQYRLLEKIGEGGCGLVFMAEQEEPVRRRVALKVIKAGMDTQAVIARFEAERQALALMDHPNIARVLDAGTTANGRPYFVMELVRGPRITDFCDQNRLGVRERLELFVQVCLAIQHAHQKGIIHRDIKPSNIMVTLHDGVPVPKVIDFGIAKAIGQRLTEKTVFTAFEQFIGTPAYMSPEQAEMSGLDLDTRSDIYSLGVLLYELLTGTPPFDGKELAESGLDALRRTLRETEPPRPSARLEGLPMAAATDLASHRGEKLPLLLKMIRGDLDWIVMKAVAKDRTRRYETTNDLAMDVRRYLSGDEVMARPPSHRYRIERFVHRNRRWVGAGIAVFMVLTAATAVSSWQAIRATRAEREQSRFAQVAEAAHQRAVDQRKNAERERLVALQRAYGSDMNIVQQALLANNTGRAVELLNRHGRRTRLASGVWKDSTGADFRQWEWRYFWNQSRSEAAFELPRQPRTIQSLAFSADGRFLASTDGRGTLKLWDMVRRSEVATLRREGRGGPCVFSRTGDRLAIVVHENSRPTQVQVWAASTRELLGEISVAAGIQALAFADEGTRLVVLSDDGTLRTGDIADPGSWQEILPMDPRADRRFRPAGAVFSPDAKFVAWSDAGKIRVVDVATGRTLHSRPVFGQGIAALRFSPDGRSLAVSPSFFDVDTDIKLFATVTGEEIGILTGHTSWIPDLAFSPDGNRLISAGADQTIRIWDISSRKELSVLKGNLSEVKCVTITPDGGTILSGAKDGALFGWDAERSSKRAAFETLPMRVFQLEFMADGRSLLSIGPDGGVSHWDTATLQPRDRLTGLSGKVERLLSSPDGTRLYAGLRDGRITVIDWPSRSVVTNLEPASGRSGALPIGVIHNGRLLVTTGPDSVVRLWDTQTWGSTVWPGSKLEPRFSRTRLTLSPDGSFLAIPGRNNEVAIIDMRTGEPWARVDLENRGLGPMAFSPDNLLLAMASGEGTVNLCNATTGVVVDVLRGHLLGVHDVAFSPDGARLASASAKNEAVKLWDVSSRQEVATLAGEGSLFGRVLFSPDGTLLAAINSSGKAHLWRAPALAEIDPMEKHP